MNILIVDDHPLTCQGLAALLGASSAAPQVRSSHSAAHAREELLRLPEPDWIFLDINLPDDPHHQLYKQLCQSHWIEKTVLISAEPTHRLIREALAAGARGFIPKTAGAELVKEGFETVLSGDFYVPAELQEQLAYESNAASGDRKASHPRLSARLLQVQAMLLRGASNKLIAKELELSLHTVKQYVSSVLAYHGVVNRLDLVLRFSSSDRTVSNF